MACRSSSVARSGPRAGLGCLVVLLLSSTCALADETAAISWRSDFEQARAEAQAQDRPLWVQFTGPWCHFCRLMERDVFVHPEVIARAREHFITVRLQSDVREDLALRYGVSGLPSTIVIAPSGAVLARQEGYVDADAFRTFLDGALTRCPSSNTRIVKRSAHQARAPLATAHTAGANASQHATSASDADDVALAGYCPVTLVKGKRLEEGQAELALQYDGREYRFANESVRDDFLRDPEPFLPAHGGYCLVSQVDRHERADGDPRFGLLYRGRLYLCADEASRSRFLKNPERYWNADVADRGFCPHCRNQKGLLVRGSPRYSVTHAGRKYFFPDAVHLAAFRESPDKYVR